MEHIEEDILELYCLDSKKIEPRRREIEAHLRICPGCRTLVEEMTSFYREVQEEAERRREMEKPPERALVVSSPLHPRLPRRGDGYRTAPAPGNLIRRLQLRITAHPLASAAGAFTFGAAMVAGLVMLLNTPDEDTNPAYAFQSTDQNLVQIRNSNHRKLWDFPSFRLKEQVESESERRVRTTVVADLDGDGRNEVVSVLMMGNERLPLCLRVFDGLQRLLFSREFVQDFQYRDRSYTPRFIPTQVVTLPAGGGKGQEIFVVAVNSNRSPSYVARFDARGKELGWFWHFGHITGMYPVTLKAGGQAKLVLIGVNDTGDTSEAGRRTSVPFASVVDPGKITGQKRSVTAPGYVMPESDAEEYYIRFAQSSPDSILTQGTVAQSLVLKDEGTLAFNLQSMGSYEGLKAEFEYTLDRQLRVLAVKTTDLTQTLVGRLLAEGKSAARPDAAYLTYLKNSVRYWNGRRWTPDPAHVDHPLPVAAGP